VSDLNTKLKKSIIDIDLTMKILEKYNSGAYDHFKPVVVKGFPPVDNRTIIDMKGDVSYSIPVLQLKKILEKYNIPLEKQINDNSDEQSVTLNKKELINIGERLMPLYSFGILNGGSATSYADSKKNSSFDKNLFNLLFDSFKKLAELSTGRAKGITPAFINPDGTPGPSFIELKMRSLLIENCSSLFQMTSFHNDESIQATYNQYRESPFLKDLIKTKNADICNAKTGIQPLLAAFTHSKMGKKKNIYVGEKGNLISLPGGHGQCFITLRNVFKELLSEGVRFVSIGNVDNIGYTPDPQSLAILALSGKQAGFDFSYKTPVDVKGGILITDDRNRLNCADLGVAIEKETVEEAEQKGSSILFNCATGLFNLEYLVENIDMIIDSLPMRFSDQDKDAGQYAQAEQVTWEVIGILDDILIFAIDKYDRFLAAKTIMENLMTSGIRIAEIESEALKGISAKLNRGLEKKLKTIYGLKLVNGKWIPKTVAELERKI